MASACHVTTYILPGSAPQLHDACRALELVQKQIDLQESEKYAYGQQDSLLDPCTTKSPSEAAIEDILPALDSPAEKVSCMHMCMRALKRPNSMHAC